jgi:spore maturation protein CgeB
MIPRDILFEISGSGIPSAVWLMDEPYDTTRSVNIGSFFDYVFLQDSSTLEFHRQNGNPNTYYLPHGFDNLEPPVKGPFRSDQPDISMIGTGFPYRCAAIEALMGTGSILIAGKKWDGLQKDAKVTVIPPISPREAAKLYQRSKINLNVHRGESDFSTCDSPMKATSPNGSLFYIAGNGGFQIADDSRCQISDFFEVGKEIVLFHDLGELKDQVYYYLHNDEERDRIRSAARRRALSEHTYSHRMKKMLDTVEGKSDGAVPHFFDKTFIRIPAKSHPAEVAPAGYLTVDLVSDDTEESAKATGMATLLNSAFLQASSLYSVVGRSACPTLREMTRNGLDYLTSDPTMGAVVYRNSARQLTGAVLSNRILWKTGAFSKDFSSFDRTFDDLLLRMEEGGHTVVSLSNDAAPLCESLPAHDTDTEYEAERFFKTWGSDPGKRLQAKKMLMLSSHIKQRGDIEGAISLARHALAIDESFADSYRHLGSLYLYQGELEMASPLLRVAWDKDPENVSNGLMLGLLLRTRKQYDEVIDLLINYLDKDILTSEKTAVMLNLGICAKEMGRIDEALQHFDAAISLEPFFIPALKEIVTLKASQGDFITVLSVLDKILQVHPDEYEALNDKGVVLYQLGKKTEAVKCITRAIKINKNYKPALDNLNRITGCV